MRCGNIIFEKRIPKSKQIPPTSISQISLPNNPYCSSIIGTYVFNLSKINNFKFYFWKATDNVNLNPNLKNVLNEVGGTITNWKESFKPEVINAAKNYTDFYNKSTAVVSSYAECDVVCCVADNFGENVGEIIGYCAGPAIIALFQPGDPLYSDNRVVLIMNNSKMNNENIKKGGQIYATLIHEFGHGLAGFKHPFDRSFFSPQMPAQSGISDGYPSAGGYIQNTTFNTIMGYLDTSFFYPEERDFATNTIGYPQSLLPLDYQGLKWAYSIKSFSPAYIKAHGVSLINPELEVQENQTQTIIGTNQIITFGPECVNVAFYFQNQNFSYKNLNGIKYSYNRVLEKKWGFYPQDIDSTISILNLNNMGVGNVFIERDGVKTDLIININCSECNFWVNQLKSEFIVNKNVYIDKKTHKKITINLINKEAKINVKFSC